MTPSESVGYKCSGLLGKGGRLGESPSQRANVLSRRFTRVGIAVVKGGPYGMMIVEVFIAEPEEAPTGGKTDSPIDVAGGNLLDDGSRESPPHQDGNPG